MTAPKSDGKVSVIATDFLSTTHKGRDVQCVAIAYHPDIINKMKGDDAQSLSYAQQAVQFLQEKNQLSLSYEIRNMDGESFIGPPSLMTEIPRILHGIPVDRKEKQTPSSNSEPLQPTLSNLGNIAQGSKAFDSTSLFENEKTKSTPQGHLIQEMAESSCSPQASSAISYPYSIEVRPADENRPQRVVFAAQLSSDVKIDDLVVEISEVRKRQRNKFNVHDKRSFVLAAKCAWRKLSKNRIVLTFFPPSIKRLGCLL